jgi:heme/copper-type cytochrome/quinol oxidase subunit 2
MYGLVTITLHHAEIAWSPNSYIYIMTSDLKDFPSFLGIVAALVILLVASIIVTVLVFVTVAYRRQKLQHRNQETPQGSCYFSCIYGFSTYIYISIVQLQYMRSRMTGLYLDYHK